MPWQLAYSFLPEGGSKLYSLYYVTIIILYEYKALAAVLGILKQWHIYVSENIMTRSAHIYAHQVPIQLFDRISNF